MYHVNLGKVQSLHNISSDPLVFGGSVSISDAIKTLEKIGQSEKEYSYCLEMAEHWKKVSNFKIIMLINN